MQAIARTHVVLPAACAAATVLAYWPGLNGGFVFDDLRRDEKATLYALTRVQSQHQCAAALRAQLDALRDGAPTTTDAADAPSVPNRERR